MLVTTRISLRSPRRTDTKAIANGQSNEITVESFAAERLVSITGNFYEIIVKVFELISIGFNTLFFFGLRSI